jgi:hypothetical protein
MGDLSLDSPQFVAFERTRPRWVMRHLAPRSKGGRPPGTGFIGSAEEFRALVFPIIRGLHAQGRRTTKEAVAEALTGRLPAYRNRATECDPKLVGRWAQRWLRKNWAGVVAEALDG